jgi:predicted enzyme related to lactoylglutathione lyase
MINHNDKEIKWKNKIPSIVHFEIPADDVERARKFYSTLFGWKIEKIETGPSTTKLELHKCTFNRRIFEKG